MLLSPGCARKPRDAGRTLPNSSDARNHKTPLEGQAGAVERVSFPSNSKAPMGNVEWKGPHTCLARGA